MEKRKNSSYRLRFPEAASVREKSHLIAGRAGVIAALLVFAGTYTYGISEYGLLLGIAFGWLPCGAAAWLTAIIVARISSLGIRYVVMLRERLPVLICMLRSEFHHKN